MPSSARIPRMATNPKGFPDSNRAPTTPVSPSGPTLRTMNRREKLRNWTIRTVNMIISIAGTTATTEACALALSSTTPPVTMRYGGFRDLASSLTDGANSSTTVAGRAPGVTSACTVNAGTRSRRQINGCSWS